MAKSGKSKGVKRNKPNSFNGAYGNRSTNGYSAPPSSMGGSSHTSDKITAAPKEKPRKRRNNIKRK